MALTRAGNLRLSEVGFTQNISSGGVLFTAERELHIGGLIEYVITLNEESSKPVSLKCTGKVVRQVKVNPDCSGRPVAVAATMDRYEFIRQE